MDNITHSLIGIAAAEGIATTRKRDRLPLWISSALANNLPDADIILTRFGPHGKLDYLLQHRGYTHTLLLAPLQSLLLLIGLGIFWRRRPELPKAWIAFLVFLGPLLHLLADSWNSYGVHPFWPLENSWHYGDLIFIVEPWLWVAFLPMVWHRSSSILGRSLSLGLLLILNGVAWYHSYLLLPVAAAISLLSLLWVGAQPLIRNDRLRLCLALSICAAAFALFGAARQRLGERFQAPGREVALLSHPANPFCWTVLTAEFTSTEYVATAWNTSPWPALISAGSCPLLSQKDTSANLQPILGAATEPSRIPIGEFRRPRSELEEIGRNCRGRAFLRYARIPFWFREKGQAYVGDLRFDRDRGIGFAEIPLLPDDSECAHFEFPWEGRFFPGKG